MKSENNCGVYEIINFTNGKRYFGASTNLIERKKIHFNLLSSGKHHNKHLQNDFNENNFLEFRIREYCDKSELTQKERSYIYLYSTTNPERGYNIYAIKNSPYLKKDKKIIDDLYGYHLTYLAEEVVQPNGQKGVNYNTFIKWIHEENPAPHWLLAELERLTNRTIKP